VRSGRSICGTDRFSSLRDGSNHGFRSLFEGFPEPGGGYAVLANGKETGLVTDIGAAIKKAYGWA